MSLAILLSGGVDSSVALHRLLRGEVTELGAVSPSDITAFYLKIWLEDELSYLGNCPWEDDLSYAREVCQKVGVELEVISLQRPYRQLVIESALGELRAGRTPSPDILCNRRVKFGAFTERLDELGSFERIATGHYARQVVNGGMAQLWRGIDPVKDQTYFLYRLDQPQLRRCLFPLGDLYKPQVRELAEQLQLPNRSRPDSQGLCFLGGVDFNDFIRAHLGERPGPIRRLDTGQTLGEHRGHWFYTLGQRKGLGLGGGPWFVIGKEVENDTLWVTHGERLEQYKKNRLRLGAMHWIDGTPVDGPLHVRVRHGPQLLDAEATLNPTGLELQLTQADPGLAPGQAAVLYRQQRCLGGGWIQ